MRNPFRSPSLFWTFAGWFLFVLVLAAVLQGLVALALVGPLNQAWRADLAELLARRAANEIAGGSGAWDDTAAAGILDRYASQARDQGLLLVLLRPDREIVFDRHLPARLRARVTTLVGGRAEGDTSFAPARATPDASLPLPDTARVGRDEAATADDADSRSTRRRIDGDTSAEGITTEPGRPRRGPDPPIRVLYRHEIPLFLGQIIAVQEVRPLPLVPTPGPGPARLLLFMPVALMLAGAAALFLFRTQVRRLRALETLAARVSEGDLDARVEDPHGDELGRLGGRLNRMTASLASARERERESDRQRRQLLADISHELATPLTSIRGYAETLLNAEVSVSSEERTAYLRSILAESERLNVLTRDLFELARLEAGAVPLNRDDLDWSELCRHTVERFRPRFESAGLTLAWKDSPGPVVVFADGHRLEQVIENLLSNALRYVPVGGRVEVSLATRGQRRLLVVEDDGPGIPASDLTLVFDRFYRADPARTHPGSGLGLAIVREIVERHGGTVRAQNHAPHGARFTVDLPSAETSER